MWPFNSKPAAVPVAEPEPVVAPVPEPAAPAASVKPEVKSVYDAIASGLLFFEPEQKGGLVADCCSKCHGDMIKSRLMKWTFMADSFGSTGIIMPGRNEISENLNMEAYLEIFLGHSHDGSPNLVIKINSFDRDYPDYQPWPKGMSTIFSRSHRQYINVLTHEFKWRGPKNPMDVLFDTADAAILAWVNENFTIAE
jgi:hypothetical protein